jgi:hypothetical protein
MTVQQDIGVKMRDRIHLQLFPLWFIKDPIFPAEEGYVCSECANKKDIAS